MSIQELTFSVVCKFLEILIYVRYLAHDIEEDDEDLKYEIFPWALGTNWRNKISAFLQRKERLWARMNYRAIVGAKCCDDVSLLENYILV